MVRLIGFALLVVLMGLMVSVGYGAEVAAAAERWQPMAGSPVAENLSMGNRKAVRFPCLLGNVKLDRASWDLPVQLDMSRCAGIRFETRCQDPRPIRSFSLYFQSGEGWYAATFAHPPSDQWQTVEVRKEQTHIEGHPAGWNKITAIRISAWRGGEVNTEFAIADLGLVEVEADIALVRGESAAGSSPEEVAPVCQFTEQMADMLRELHLGYVMLSDLDLGPAKLKSYRVVILPHNPKMPASVDQDIADYMNGGGKVIACYGLTRNIAAAGGVVLLQHRPQKWEGQFAAIATDARILPGAPETAKQRSWNIMEVKPAAGTQIAAMWVDQSGKATGMPAILVSPQMIYMSHVFLAEDADTKRRLLLAMIGKLFPEAWSVAAKHAVEEIGRFAAYDSFTTAQQMLAKYPAAEKNLAEAAHQRQTAMTLTGEGKFIEAIDI